MKSENNIDKYFELVKQNPPLMDIEKVHQIITEAEAKTKVEVKAEVKKGHRKLIKFTIMTTIFAAILSAVLWWSGENETQDTRHMTQDKGQENVSSIKYQDTRPMGIDANFTDTNSASSGNANTKNAESNNVNNLIAIANPIESSSEIGNEQTNTTASSIDKSTQQGQQAAQQSISFDPDTIKPTDGSRFVLRLSKEELMSIGFTHIGDIDSIIYENKHEGNLFRYGYKKRNVLDHVEDGEPEYRLYIDQVEEKYPCNEQVKNNFDFYPIYSSSKYFTDIKRKSSLGRSFFESANDTLLPIVFPNFGRLDGDEILWFLCTDSLVSILSKNHKDVLDDFLRYKAAKKYHLKKNMITYSSPFLIDKSKALKLTKNELERLGFVFNPQNTGYTGRGSLCELQIVFANEVNAAYTTFNYDKKDSLDQESGSVAVLVTDSLGNPIFNTLGLYSTIFPNEDEFIKQIPLLVPVEVSINKFRSGIVFWFLPNENFYKAIAKGVSDEIKAEYNYIIAEDKSTLVKPECKYFDECKNTLKVSSFKVYPNPASANATVSFTLPEAINGRITLVDLAGRERQVLKPQTSYAKGQHSITVDLGNVPEGMYQLVLYTNKGVQAQRVIVAR